MKIFRYIANHGLWTLFSLLFTAIIILIAVYTYMELGLPNVESLKDVHLQVPLKIYSADNKLMATYGVKRRIPVTLAQIPKQLVDAVLATEDARYYEHPGVDFIGIVRAGLAVIASGKKVQGASTITMQVARNFFLTRKKTYSRKIKEILLALKIDQDFSKDKVLELYLNKIYLGNRAYGVAAGAQVYYGKKLSQLSLAQMAMLAGLPQAPSADNPIRNPVAAKERRNHVLQRMLEVGFIDKAAYQQAIQAPITASYHQQKVQLKAPYLADMVRQLLLQRYGSSIYESGMHVYTTVNSHDQKAAKMALDKGLIAYTHRHGYREPIQNFGPFSLDVLGDWVNKLQAMPAVPDMQRAAVTEVDQRSIQALLTTGTIITVPWSGLSWARPFQPDRRWPGPRPKSAAQIVKVGDVIAVSQKGGSWVLNQVPTVQGAIVSVNPANGAILALSGGFDYGLSNFNRATQAVRQPGSNFKPFIYSAALAKGMTLATLINDAPVVLKDSGENQLWRPRNDTLKFYGPTRVRVGLVESRNLVSIRLLQATGIPFTLNYVKAFGFDPNDLPHTLSLALGSAGVTPWQIARGYSVFANGGFLVQPYVIDHIIDQHGTTIAQAQPQTACASCLLPHGQLQSAQTQPMNQAPETITPQNAYLITNALQGVIQHGTGRRARVLHRLDIAGKTGTTNNQVDAWFSGFNSRVETTVWVGFDDSNESLYEYGSQAALPIWINYMRTALKGTPPATMAQPSDIVNVRIDPKTGLLAPPGSPQAIFEVFRKQYVPTQFSDQGQISPYAASANSPEASAPSQTDAPSEPLF